MNSGDLQYYRTAILSSLEWPEANRAFQNDLAAIFSHNQCPFDYCHAFLGEGVGFNGSEEAVSRRVTRKLWESRQAAKTVGRKTFEYRPGGGILKRETRYITNYLNDAALTLKLAVESDGECVPLPVKVSKHLRQARKLLPLLQSKTKPKRRKRGRGASFLKDNSETFSERYFAAEKCAAEGLFVIPLYSAVDGVCDCKKGKECGKRTGKHPRIRRWLQCATRSKALLRLWWHRWPNAGVGIKTGTLVSRGLYLIVIDIDRRNFGHGVLSSLLDEMGEFLPETRTVISSDGWHYYFLIRSDVSPSSFAVGGMEIKGSGNLAVYPPSIHRSGHVYRLENDDTPIAELTGAFAEWVLTRTRTAKVPIAERHKFLVRCGRKLAALGFSELEIIGTLKMRLDTCCEQGGRVIDEAEIEGIAGWAYKEEAEGALAATQAA